VRSDNARAAGKLADGMGREPWKHHALQVLKEQKERTREIEKRRQILANCAREPLVLRPMRGTASVNVLMPPRSALRRL
jgi:hypothetical protein